MPMPFRIGLSLLPSPEPLSYHTDRVFQQTRSSVAKSCTI